MYLMFAIFLTATVSVVELISDVKEKKKFCSMKFPLILLRNYLL